MVLCLCEGRVWILCVDVRSRYLCIVIGGYLRIWLQRPQHTRGGTVRQQTTPANRDTYYPDSLLFI